MKIKSLGSRILEGTISHPHDHQECKETASTRFADTITLSKTKWRYLERSRHESDMMTTTRRCHADKVDSWRRTLQRGFMTDATLDDAKQWCSQAQRLKMYATLNDDDFWLGDDEKKTRMRLNSTIEWMIVLKETWAMTLSIKTTTTALNTNLNKIFLQHDHINTVLQTAVNHYNYNLPVYKNEH